MPYIKSTHDGASLFYRDYTPSKHQPFQPSTTRDIPRKPTLVFTSAWPFSSKMYDHLLLPLVESHGYRCLALDRRGFGKSEWAGPSLGNQDQDGHREIDYDTFSDDLLQVLEYSGVADDKGGFIGIGASLGCGEFFLTLSRSSKVKASCRGLIFLGPSLPIPMQTDRKSTGPPRSFWDTLLINLRTNRQKHLRSALSYIWGDIGSGILTAEEKQWYEDIALEADPLALERTVQIFLDRDFTDLITEEGPRLELGVGILVLHGDADAANPVETGPGMIKEKVKGTRIVVYEDAAHGIAATHKKRCLNDILAFVGSG